MSSKSSGRQAAHKGDEKFERAPRYQNLLHSEILQNQQSDINGVADTLLICDGGTVRVHAFIIQAASPFLQLAIASQGENYPLTREIMIPDFSVKEIEKMVDLIYKGYADLRTDKEVQRVQETLKFFQVRNVNYSSGNFDKIKGCLKVQELNRIPQDIFKTEVKEESKDWHPKVIVIDSGSPTHSNLNSKTNNFSKTESPFSPPPPPPPVLESPTVRRSGRTPKPIINLEKDKKAEEEQSKSDDSDYKAESDNEASDDEMRSPSRRGRTVNKLQPVVKLPRIIATTGSPGTNPKTNASPSPSPTSSGVKPNMNVGGTPNKKVKEEDSGTDTEDEDFEAPDYTDEEWLYHQTHLCQSCNKVHDNPSSASLCITSHKTLRCYFCFRCYSTTDILFKHFKKRHKAAGRDATLVCYFCDQAIPYKSVSCHVISTHLKKLGEKPKSLKEKEKKEAKLKDKNQQKTKPSSSKSNEARNGPGRIVGTPTSSGAKKVTSRRRSRSRSVSTERVSSSERERNPVKKPKKVTPASSPPAPAQASTSNGSKDKTGGKTKQTKLTFANMKKMIKIPETDDTDDNMELRVPDLNVIIEKTMASGEIITFKLQKKRLEGMP